MKLRNCLVWALAALTLTACSNDDEPQNKENEGKTISNIDASNYSNWTYVNLITGETESHRDFTAWENVNYQTNTAQDTIAAQGSLADVKIDWHIALRRELIKTNGGAAFATSATSFAEVTPAMLAAGTWEKDAVVSGAARLVVDLSKMRQGLLTYSLEDSRNPVLTSWVTKSGGHGNLVYTPTKNIYVLRTKEGKYFKLQFTDFLNAVGEKGFVSLTAVPYSS